MGCAAINLGTHVSLSHDAFAIIITVVIIIILGFILFFCYKNSMLYLLLELSTLNGKPDVSFSKLVSVMTWRLGGRGLFPNVRS